MSLDLDWKLSNAPMADIGFAVGQAVVKIVQEQISDLSDLFPLQDNWYLEYHFDDHWMFFRISSRSGEGSNLTTRPFTDEEVEKIQQKVLPLNERSHAELFQVLGKDWFSWKLFTYVGPIENSCVSWTDIYQHLVDWLNHLVLPEVLRRNKSRVLHAIPVPPQFDFAKIKQALWVLECEESCKQGTGFMLAGVGLVTCQHVLGPKTYAIHPASSLSKKISVNVVAQNPDIDLAILSVNSNVGDELLRGSADKLEQMHHIAVTGFPNFRLGDSGIISPGLVVGFRTKSGIRRILTNAPIIAGNSGGPVLADGNVVVGVAVTGAERMEEAQETEDHGIIPIDALQLISSY